MKVLITGGAGFVGGHLTKRLLLESDVQIDLLDNFSRAVRDGFLYDLGSDRNVRLIERNLLEPGATTNLDNDYDFVVHLAAIVGVPHVLRDPYGVLRKNESMTFAALDLAQQQKRLTRFVFASTSEIVAGTLQQYGIEIPTPETAPICVPDPADSRHTYLLSKLYGEALCHHSGLPFTCVRPHNVYGPRMGLVHVIPDLAQKIRALPEYGELEVASWDHSRTFCYVDDAVEIMTRLMLGGNECTGVFNLGVQEPEVTISEVAQCIVDTIGKPVGLVKGPVMIGSPRRRCPDMSKTTVACGFSGQVTLADGIARTLDWYDANVFEKGGPSAI